MESQYTKPNISILQSTYMEISISLSCLLVHEPLYQTTVVCCNPVFHCGSLYINHCAVLHVRMW